MNAPAPIDFAPLMADVARRLLGEPNKAMSRPKEPRWGSKGSLSIDLDKGTWHDHEAKVGGGTLALVERERRCDKRGALEWLTSQGLIERQSDSRAASGGIFYDYDDPDTGEVAYRVERRGKAMVPPFLHHGPDGRGAFHAAKGCMAGVKRLPYRASALRAAPADAIVFVVEGEKDADRLASAGLIATTNSGGSGKFGPELVPHFAGRRVVIIPDNDKPGRDHAADIANKLAGVATVVATLPLPGPDKSDVSDWLARGGSAFELRQKAEAALNLPAETFPIADLAAWAHTEPAPKAFTMAGFIPAGEVTLFTGPGGTNKSTFGLQLCACSAAALPMLGVAVAPGPALYVTAEDEDRENHWRLRKVAERIGTTLDRLAGRLHVVSLRGRLNNELATFDGEGRLHAAPACRLLRATIEATGSRLIVLDNVAHLFAGNENDRGHVTAFINLLYQLCRDLGCTVVLIGHPNKVGDSYSGSTAWLNAVRSQIVLGKPEGSPDPDARVLTLGKANYARADQQLAFRWHDFALVREEDLPASVREELATVAQAAAENETFLRCLAKATEEKRATSPNRTASNFAPRVFAVMTSGRGVSEAGFEAAMERLLHLGTIRNGERVYQRDNRAWVTGLGVVEKSAPTLAPTPAQTSAPTLHEPAPTSTTDLHALTPFPLKGEPGAATRAAAPSPNDDRPRRHGGMILTPDDLADHGTGGLDGWPD